MRTIKKLSSLLALMALVVLSCQKVADLPVYEGGTAATLTSSTATIAAPAADSNKVVLTLNWSDPKFGTDSNNVKHIIQIDSAGKGFARAASKTVMGNQKSASYTAKELNDILLSRGYAFNVPVDMDVRIISSYANNNDRQTSNTLRIKMTPYKIPPKVALPASNKLFLVGGATPGGWNNPVPAPAQELTRIDETTWGGIFALTPGSYLLLPVNGSWDVKYGVAGNNNSNDPNGGDFRLNGGDFASPTAAGTYKIIVDFQTGKFTVTPFTQQYGVPSDLYIVGGATPGGWNNPVPVPAQRFNRLSNAIFEIPSIALTAGEKYLFLPENGNWGKKFGAENGGATNINLGGPFKPEGADMPAPTVTGNYKITVDFLSGKYTLVKL